MHHLPDAFFTQNVGIECGEILSRTCPASRRPSKESSMVWTWACGSGHCRVTQYIDPDTRSILCRTPRSTGSSAAILSGKTYSYSRASEYSGFPESCNACQDCDAKRSSRVDLGSAALGHDDAMSSLIALKAVSVGSGLVRRHACSISPAFKSRRKCVHERPGGLVIVAASEGGFATTIARTRLGEFSEYCTTLNTSLVEASLTAGDDRRSADVRTGCAWTSSVASSHRNLAGRGFAG
jgi:hypothetical protein